MMNVRSALMILLPFVSACATPQVVDYQTALQRVNADQVEVLNGTASRPYRNLGVVKGAGCLKSTFDTNIPETDAIRNLKIQAASLSANAVQSTACRNVTIDWFTDCFNLTECSGEAIIFLDK